MYVVPVAGKQSPRMKGIMERTQALVFVAKVARRRLWWDVVERLWSCLVSTPVTVKVLLPGSAALSGYSRKGTHSMGLADAESNVYTNRTGCHP